MPYIDPITGAFVADSLNALPPGYNQASPSDAANIAKMRASITNQATQTPAPSFTPSFIQPIQGVMQNMPGAPVGQAAISMGSDMFGGLLGNLYGAYKGITGGEYGKSTDIAQQNAALAAQNLHYTPPTQQGQNLVSAINKLPEQITGSSMGIGPLPELMGMNASFTPDDLRAGATSAITDVRNFPMDYANAKAGLLRDYPTLGSRAAGATDTATNLAKPLAEMAYNQVMETGGIKSPFGMPDIPVANFAVKPKGGNWPTNLGSTLPLSEQGELGKHLSEAQYSDPIAVFHKQLEKHYPRDVDNRQLLADFEAYQTKRIGLALDPNSPERYLTNAELNKKIADEFAESYNAGTIGNQLIELRDKKLHTASEIEQALPAYNAWVMGPYQKYITNQMGTGLAADPLLQAVNESGVPPHEIFGQDIPRDWQTETVTNRANRVRNNFSDTIFGYDNSPEKQNAIIGKTTATMPEGIAYENALDASIYPKGPYSFTEKEGFPVSAKLDRNTLISDFLSSPEEQTGFSEIRKKVFQDLLAGNLDPAKLSNVTPATVTRQMIKDKIAEFKEAQLSKKGAAEWIPKRAAEMPTDMAFNDGSKMTIITPEMANADENTTARDLGQITIDLNQCVGSGCHATQDYPGHGPWLVPHTGKPPRGKVEVDKYGYLRRLKDGQIEIASLKDPEGVSQATVELRLKKLGLRDKEDLIYDWLSLNNPEAKTEYNSNLRNFGQEEAVRNALQLYPELKELIKQKTKKSIEQLKGKDNGEVDEAYVPQMVEWLNKNADNLIDVRELNHLKEVHDLDNHYSSIGKMVDERSHWYSPTVEEFFKKADDEKLLPRFFTTDQFAQLATDHGVDLSAEPPRKLSDWDKQTLREEVYSVLIKDPESLYLQDNLKDHVVQNLDILFGDRKPEGQVPLDVHRKLADMLLDHNGKYREQLVSALGQLADKGPNGWVNNFTEPQISNMLNIMAGWFEKHPMEKLPSNADFERAIAKHPDPFNEISIPESPWHPSENDLVNAVHEMEPENAGEFDQVHQIRQHAYEGAIQAMYDMFTTNFIDQARQIPALREEIASDMREHPNHYHLGNYSPEAREAIIQRFITEGFTVNNNYFR